VLVADGRVDNSVMRQPQRMQIILQGVPSEDSVARQNLGEVPLYVRQTARHTS